MTMYENLSKQFLTFILRFLFPVLCSFRISCFRRSLFSFSSLSISFWYLFCICITSSCILSNLSFSFDCGKYKLYHDKEFLFSYLSQVLRRHPTNGLIFMTSHYTKQNLHHRKCIIATPMEIYSHTKEMNTVYYNMPGGFCSLILAAKFYAVKLEFQRVNAIDK